MRAVYLFGAVADGAARLDSDTDVAGVPADASVREQKMAMMTEPAQRRMMKLRLMDRLCERRMDLVVARDTTEPLVTIARGEGVRL